MKMLKNKWVLAGLAFAVGALGVTVMKKDGTPSGKVIEGAK